MSVGSGWPFLTVAHFWPWFPFSKHCSSTVCLKYVAMYQTWFENTPYPVLEISHYQPKKKIICVSKVQLVIAIFPQTLHMFENITTVQSKCKCPMLKLSHFGISCSAYQKPQYLIGIVHAHLKYYEYYATPTREQLLQTLSELLPQGLTVFWCILPSYTVYEVQFWIC